MNVGSIFSGGGGGDLGLERAGHTLAFACEIDPKARAVFRYHHPGLAIYHDVRDITYDQLIKDNTPIPQLLIGGSPCQDLSIAGHRAGLDGLRSGLFFEQCRIADELCIDWMLWENVVGALSSNNGSDFASVLKSITGYTATVPDGGWRNTGICLGPKRFAVWRVFDSQYFGVSQQRRRIFVVGGPRNMATKIAQVLVEPESSDRDNPTSTKTKTQTRSTSSTRFVTSSTGKVAQISQTLLARYGSRGDLETESFVIDTKTKTMRRFTPKECERLMGWPDDYTSTGIDDHGNEIKLADTARYKICGNGIVSAVTEWIGRRLPNDQQSDKKSPK